jgi:hypothetical protein
MTSVTEVRPGGDPPSSDHTRRAALMFATLGFAALPRVPPDMAPAFKALHQWLDGWKGIGDLAAGMHRQGFDLYLAQHADEGWRCTFYVTGREHSLTSTTGSACEKTLWLAVQGAAARGLDKMGRAQ